ncbi:MAG: cyclic nucleotide-binding domain-containing protein [Gemmatimonadaceae bacterium]
MGTANLAEIPFFAELPDQLLWHLGRAAETVSYAPDDRLFRSGSPRQAIWVILEGTLAIETAFGDLPTRLATLGAGDVIGESLLLQDETHHTEGRVLQPLKALRFDRAVGPGDRRPPQARRRVHFRSQPAGRLRRSDAP